MAEALHTGNWVELIYKTGFAKIALDEDLTTIVIYMVVLEVELLIHFSRAIVIVAS